jgi:hypothetical protein
MERRLLVNYRVDAAVLTRTLPAPFRPAVVHGYGIAGICLIRLGDIRPAGLPAALGFTSENAAHRIAVEWDTAEGPVTGVYIPRRDTSSRLTAALGGRAFPGWHHRSTFRVQEAGGSYRVEFSGAGVEVTVLAHRTDDVMAGSVFDSVEEASAFFRCAPIGYAATPAAGVFDGVGITTDAWAIDPLHIDEVRSSVFDGFAEPDSAFLMAGIDTTWRPLPELVATP